MRYEPWDWVFSTGVYMDDINAAFMTSLYQTGGLLVLVGGLLLLLGGVANRSLQRTLVFFKMRSILSPGSRQANPCLRCAGSTR